MVLKFVAQANSSKPWNKVEEFSEVEEQRGRKNDATLMKESRFGRQCNASEMHRHVRKLDSVS